MLAEVVVFAPPGQMRAEVLDMLTFTGLFALLLAVVAIAWVYGQPRQPGDAAPRVGAIKLGLRLAGGAAALGVALTAWYCGTHFTSLQRDDDHFVLTYVFPWHYEEELYPEDIEAVVAGGGGGRGTWYRNCLIRFWLRGGGNLVSVTRADFSREQCVALRDELSAWVSRAGAP
jgi:hypothetical protein